MDRGRIQDLKLTNKQDRNDIIQEEKGKIKPLKFEKRKITTLEMLLSKSRK